MSIEILTCYGKISFFFVHIRFMCYYLNVNVIIIPSLESCDLLLKTESKGLPTMAISVKILVMTPFDKLLEKNLAICLGSMFE